MSRQEVEAREKEWVKAFNGGDASGVAGLYTEDGRVLPPNSDVVQGRSAIEGFVAEFLAMGASISFDLLGAHESPDLCAVVGRYELEFRPEGAPPQKDSGKFIEVWRRQPDGSWLMAEDIFNSSLPAPG
jgi:uncharacterized protein (TIGR02246 family)